MKKETNEPENSVRRRSVNHRELPNSNALIRCLEVVFVPGNSCAGLRVNAASFVLPSIRSKSPY